ncbi:MAG TPA: hypothetical protein VFU02_08940 [Polyangiaceae bacterium]|nr:hypothetical protein [Polyangiaceae bacterium]
MSNTPAKVTALARGFTAGALSGGFNLLYFYAYLAATELSVREPTWASVVVSSLVPCLLAALGYSWLARRTARADVYFALVVAAIVITSFEGALRTTLPDGSLKPPGFDGLVMPMHVVVGLAAALVIPPSIGLRLARRARLRLPCVKWE